jgi:hypothetical protein
MDVLPRLASPPSQAWRAPHRIWRGRRRAPWRLRLSSQAANTRPQGAPATSKRWLVVSDVIRRSCVKLVPSLERAT